MVVSGLVSKNNMKVSRLIKLLSKMEPGAEVIIPKLSYLEGKRVETPVRLVQSSDGERVSVYTEIRNN